MKYYLNNFTLLLQKIAAVETSATPVIVQLEPDLWGFAQSSCASCDNAASVPAPVTSSGYTAPDSTQPLSALPNNFAGLAQAYIALRNKFAPNVILAYHVTHWSTSGGYDPTQSSTAHATQVGQDAGAFYNSLGARFDMSFQEVSDTDSGFYTALCGGAGSGTRAWWNAAAFNNFLYYLNGYYSKTGQKSLLWQVPSGNTVMLTMNQTNMHWQDDRAQYFLQPGNPNLPAWINAGILGVIFSQDQQSPGSQCDSSMSGTDVEDYRGDGITNPPSIGIPTQAQSIYPGNGTTTFRTSTVTDDDGGFIRAGAAAYYSGGPLAVCP